jgi:hypothetical protein
LRIAFWALIPNVLPVTVYFRTLAHRRDAQHHRRVACVVLGVAVGNHFLVRPRLHRAVRRRTRHGGGAARRGAVDRDELALCVDSWCSRAAGLRHQVEFAVLSAATLAFAWLMDYDLTPALCYGLGMKLRPRPRGRRKSAPPPAASTSGSRTALDPEAHDPIEIGRERGALTGRSLAPRGCGLIEQLLREHGGVRTHHPLAGAKSCSALAPAGGRSGPSGTRRGMPIRGAPISRW